MICNQFNGTFWIRKCTITAATSNIPKPYFYFIIHFDYLIQKVLIRKIELVSNGSLVSLSVSIKTRLYGHWILLNGESKHKLNEIEMYGWTFFLHRVTKWICDDSNWATSKPPRTLFLSLLEYFFTAPPHIFLSIFASFILFCFECKMFLVAVEFDTKQ